jgi:hypothetical protein
LDEQDLLEDEDFSLNIDINGKNLKIISLTRTDNLVEIVTQQRLEVVPDFLKSDPLSARFSGLDLNFKIVPRTIDIDTRTEQTMTLSFEIVS